jgi:hypothetical protein
MREGGAPFAVSIARRRTIGYLPAPTLPVIDTACVPDQSLQLHFLNSTSLRSGSVAFDFSLGHRRIYS